MADGKSYLAIQEWMLSLDLRPAEMMAFALVAGFTRNGRYFDGSIDYVCRWLNVSRPTAIETLRHLTERGLLLKEETRRGSVKVCRYSVAPQYFAQSKNLTSASQKTLLATSQNSLPNNISKTLTDNIDNQDDIIDEAKAAMARLRHLSLN